MVLTVMGAVPTSVTVLFETTKLFPLLLVMAKGAGGGNWLNT